MRNMKISNIFVALLILFSVTAGRTEESQTASAGKIPQDVVDAVRKTDYNEVRIKKFPVAVQCWTYREYSFLETLDKVSALGIRYIQAYPGQRMGEEYPGVSFGHDMTDETIAAVRKRLREARIAVVAYGVVDTGRTEESMRKVFDFARKMGLQTVVCEPRDEDFTLLEKLVKEYNLRIAVHNHPAPNKYAYPQTALDLIQGKDDRIGICADTGHWMREGLKPVECLRLLEGRIVDLHLKDRSDFGKGPTAEDVAWGTGSAGVRDILAELTLQDFAGFVTIEYENQKEVATPEPAIQKGLEYVRGITYYEGYQQLLRPTRNRYEKHGWNHYGPGYFELDQRTGILKSQGGMGLFWYSAKTYKDFILELDFKCTQPNTNSGIFLRVPEVPTSDDYIYHSFEIQIQDDGTGIHKTAAAYDAEAPSGDASKPVGEWNHYKITFRGRRIEVELNGKKVLNWEAEPRGKVKDFAMEGYVGLQNHDSISPVYFKDIFIKEIE